MKRNIVGELQSARLPIVPKCTKEGQECSRVISFPDWDEACTNFCSVYYKPAAKWRLGDCPMADEHLRTKVESTKEKIRIGQQKQKKGK